ncbi:MAG: hypothetical protein ACRDJV_02385 [Actinomycetota bacterium]
MRVPALTPGPGDGRVDRAGGFDADVLTGVFRAVVFFVAAGFLGVGVFRVAFFFATDFLAEAFLPVLLRAVALRADFFGVDFLTFDFFFFFVARGLPRPFDVFVDRPARFAVGFLALVFREVVFLAGLMGRGT